MLYKAMFQYCEDAQIDWLVIGARSPLDRQYEALLFKEVFPERGFIPLSHGGNIPHRILAFEIASAQSRWLEANHPLYSMVFETRHPDIHVHDTGSAFKHRARRPALASQLAPGH